MRFFGLSIATLVLCLTLAAAAHAQGQAATLTPPDSDETVARALIQDSNLGVAEGGNLVRLSTNVLVNQHGECRWLDNTDTAKNFFVPTKSALEWASFYNSDPAGVTIAGCCDPATITLTSVDGQTATAQLATGRVGATSGLGQRTASFVFNIPGTPGWQETVSETYNCTAAGWTGQGVTRTTPPEEEEADPEILPAVPVTFSCQTNSAADQRLVIRSADGAIIFDHLFPRMEGSPFQNTTIVLNDAAVSWDAYHTSDSAFNDPSLKRTSDVTDYMNGEQECHRQTWQVEDWIDYDYNDLVCHVSWCAAEVALDPINAQCGSDNGQDVDHWPAHPDQLCAAGAPNPAQFDAGSRSFNWTCSGSNGGSDATCSAQAEMGHWQVDGITSPYRIGYTVCPAGNPLVGTACMKPFPRCERNEGLNLYQLYKCR